LNRGIGVLAQEEKRESVATSNAVAYKARFNGDSMDREQELTLSRRENGEKFSTISIEPKRWEGTKVEASFSGGSVRRVGVHILFKKCVGGDEG